ncbi:probable galacturonosyltransferase 6 isoform X3 [Zingiber officinale]|uniref:probable galacturonosyltransferase 6 isoform X3 n=1 Tax=Zingiber officinale TaxID=94328 RepID=UPI001C4A9D13|nr:probable galacturonosyltransferase 6 isoform X3 [Zingiber officinale]
MVALRRPWRKVVIYAFLVVSFIAPLVLFFSVPAADNSPFHEKKNFLNISSGILNSFSPRHTSNAMQLNSMEQEVSEDPLLKGAIYKDDNLKNVQIKYNQNVTISGATNGNSSSRLSGNGDNQPYHVPNSAGGEDKKQKSSDKITDVLTTRKSPSRPSTAKIWEMEDQLVMAKAYVHFSSSNSNFHLLRELKLRIKEIDRVLSRSNKDADLFTSDLQKMKNMEVTLSKARKSHPECSAMASKLRAQLFNAEEQLRAQQNQASYLVHLTGRTFPRGFHCLSMRLTTEYFALHPDLRKLPNSHNFDNPDLYHYAIFSDNVLACLVVVKSTVNSSLEPEKIVFHVVTDSFNFPAMLMWFLLNPPGKATIQIQSLDDFVFLPTGFNSMFRQSAKADPRVVQKDLRELWNLDMKGNVNGAVEMCKDNVTSQKLEMLVNVANPAFANSFDGKACLWAFGMNIFDLQEWRTRGLAATYHKWNEIGSKHLWKAGSLPLGQLLFYNHTMTLDRRWHVFGLGSDLRVGVTEIEKAAVIHYDGNMKPWLDTAITKYRGYWTRFLDYSNPYFRQCNIHG